MDAPKTIGARIRACREQAGMTQSELASAAFVTRQSVGNWESGKTLPDVQSLQLVSQALGTTVDGLLGDEVPAIARETTEARRQLTRCLASLAVLFVFYLVVCVIDVSFLRGEPNYTALLACNGIRITLAAFSIPVAKRMREIARGRELGDAVEIMLFVEGYPAGKEPPNNIFYRTILTNIPALYTLFVVALAAVYIAIVYA